MYGGMRGIKGLVYETSQLDEMEGIRFRNLSIPELLEGENKLPTAAIFEEGKQPLPEALFWLLLTGKVPSERQAKEFSKELMTRGLHKDDEVFTVLGSLPTDLHPMSQLSIGITTLQQRSKFAKAYQDNVAKPDYWKSTLEDSLNLVAQVPYLAAFIYRRSFKHGTKPLAPDLSLDWSGNYAHMMGYEYPHFHDCLRLYLTIHTDHEGGNASAHATHLVGSTLSDPYLSLAAGMNALAGPLHGLANQEVLTWLDNIQKILGDEEPTPELLSKIICEHYLDRHLVIPGYGHAVLRKPDPRYMTQRSFAKKYFPHDKLFKLVSMLYDVVPDLLVKYSRANNPWPNVDAHSGVLLQHYGFTQQNYYTVLFGVSRTIGVLSGLVWDRILQLPLERPKSHTTEHLLKMCENNDYPEEKL